jgi:predicted ferric reductase
LSYEAFLRGHQVLAALFVYSLWRHLPSHATLPRAYLYIAVALFSLMCLAQAGLIVFRNGIVTHRCARAHISHYSGAVRVRIYLEKPVTIQPGQHIILWIPSVSFWSFAQSHPFVVMSWTNGPQKTLDLFVKPRRGLTRELLLHAKSPHVSSPLVLISGPHGRSEAVDGYESVLMVASGFGIAAQLPYLKRLIYGHNARNVRTRRIHLVWEFSDIGECAAQDISFIADSSQKWDVPARPCSMVP